MGPIPAQCETIHFYFTRRNKIWRHFRLHYFRSIFIPRSSAARRLSRFSNLSSLIYWVSSVSAARFWITPAGSPFRLVRSLAIYFRLLVFPLRADDFAAVSSKLEKQFLFSSPKISFVSAAYSPHYIYPAMRTVTTVGYHALFRQSHLNGALLTPSLRNTNYQTDMSTIQVNLYCHRPKRISCSNLYRHFVVYVKLSRLKRKVLFK